MKRATVDPRIMDGAGRHSQAHTEYLCARAARHADGRRRVLARLTILSCAMSCSCLALGCGDASGGGKAEEESQVDPGGQFDHLEPAELTGMTVVLLQQSSGCTPRARVGIDAVVGDEKEFPSEKVAGLIPPCDGSPAVPVEGSFTGSSFVFDFAALEAPVAFPHHEFEGYQVSVKRHCGSPSIAKAAVNSDLTNVALHASRVTASFDRLSLNLAGMTIQPGDFIQLDLTVVRLACATPYP